MLICRKFLLLSKGIPHAIPQLETAREKCFSTCHSPGYILKGHFHMWDILKGGETREQWLFCQVIRITKYSAMTSWLLYCLKACSSPWNSVQSPAHLFLKLEYWDRAGKSLGFFTLNMAVISIFQNWTILSVHEQTKPVCYPSPFSLLFCAWLSLVFKTWRSGKLWIKDEIKQ